MHRWSFRYSMGLCLLAALVLASACGGRRSSQSPPNPPSNLAYPVTTVEAMAGQALPPMAPTVNGEVDAFTIGPALPPGLRFNGQTGVIDGTPLKSMAATIYRVVASNRAGTSATDIALLVAGRVPDLRFQWTEAFGTYSYVGWSLMLGTPPDGIGGPTFTKSGGSAFWGPLQISSPTGDAWRSLGLDAEVPLVGGVSSAFTTDHLDVLDQRLDGFCNQGMLIASLDLSVRGFGVVATRPTASTGEYVSYRAEVQGLDGLVALGTAQGHLGGVVTAVASPGKTYTNTPGTGKILAAWATRQGDVGTYEVQVVSGTPLELSLLLPALGQQGYVVTAFGAGDQLAYLAVCTRPTGSTAPHVIQVEGPDLPTGPTVQDGFIPIGWMYDPDASKAYWIFQR